MIYRQEAEVQSQNVDRIYRIQSGFSVCFLIQ